MSFNCTKRVDRGFVIFVRFQSVETKTFDGYHTAVACNPTAVRPAAEAVEMID